MTKKCSYLIIGSGRLAKHWQCYLNTLNLSYDLWDRHQDPHLLKSKIHSATHVLICISDSAIESFYRKNLAGLDKVCVHFSGALQVDEILAAHPLMTFGPDIYPLEVYQKIHFVISDFQNLSEALPGWPNSFSVIPAQERALYHAWCVISGNFSQILFSAAAKQMQKWDIPEQAFANYMQQSLTNIAHNSQALTGPLARKDLTSIEANLRALEDSPYRDLYLAFTQLLQINLPTRGDK